MGCDRWLMEQAGETKQNKRVASPLITSLPQLVPRANMSFMAVVEMMGSSLGRNLIEKEDRACLCVHGTWCMRE
jgi:hypothetical protein